MSILARIRASGGDVTRNKWRITLRRGRLSADAIAWIAKNKDALTLEIWPEYDDWQERAAIREFDGGQDRSDAEESAYLEVISRA